MLRPVTVLLLACLPIALSACSSGPSDLEVETAMKARINEMDAGDPGSPKADSAKNIECTASAADSYTCDVEVEITIPGAGRMKRTAQLRMVKVNGAWTYDKDQALSM